MYRLFWNVFVNSGSIDAFLAYREFESLNKDKENGSKQD